jgi:hypothetical protein
MTPKFSFHQTGLRFEFGRVKLEAFGMTGVMGLVAICLIYLFR